MAVIPSSSSSSLSNFLSFIFPSKPPPICSNLHFPRTQSYSAVTIDNDTLRTVNPALAHSNTLFFKSAYNVQVIVGEHEPEENLMNRFRREVLKAGVLQECKRRRFFENMREKKKRKAREAARRNSKRRFMHPKYIARKEAKEDSSIKKKVGEQVDNWEFYEVDLPYS